MIENDQDIEKYFTIAIKWNLFYGKICRMIEPITELVWNLVTTKPARVETLVTTKLSF